MKKAFLVWVTAAMLVLAGSAAWATSSLMIYDHADGSVTVLFGGFPHFGSSTSYESASGYLGFDSPYFTGGPQSVILDDPGGGASDFLKIWAENVYTLRFVFESKGAPSFTTDLNALVSPVHVAELNTGNELSSYFFLGGVPPGSMNIFVTSEPDVVPLPATVLLLGSGLLGLAGWRTLKKG